MSDKLTQHEMLALVKEQAIELGRNPTRDEFLKYCGHSNRYIAALWGSYSALLWAAGLGPEPPVRLTNQIFERDIETVLKEHKPLEQKPKPTYAPTLILGDTHFPFINQRALDEVYKFAEKNKPARIIQVGDLYDMYAHSKFPRSQNIYGPDQEEDLGRAGAEAMWKTLKRIAPNAECVQLKGNHDVRPVKRTMEVAPASERAVSFYLNMLMTFDGVKLIEDPRQEYFFDDVQVIHGYGSKAGQHRDFALMNTIKGHNHKGYTVFRRFRGQTFWELDPGFLGDAESKVFGYSSQKMYDMTVGFGWLDNFGPRFVPL